MKHPTTDCMFLGPPPPCLPHRALTWIPANWTALPKREHLVAIAEDKEDQFDVDLLAALRIYEARDAERCSLWREKFTR